MSETHQWNVEIEQVGTITGQIHSSTIYYSGPFPVGTTQVVVDLSVENTGDTEGDIYWQLYEYPGDTQLENLLNEGVILCGIGTGCHVGPLQAVIPVGSGPYPVGVKVWGESETEPSWG